jgi:hypothetical protein
MDLVLSVLWRLLNTKLESLIFKEGGADPSKSFDLVSNSIGALIYKVYLTVMSN